MKALFTIANVTRRQWHRIADHLTLSVFRYRDDREYAACASSRAYTLRSLGIEPHPDPVDAVEEDGDEPKRRPKARGARA